MNLRVADTVDRGCEAVGRGGGFPSVHICCGNQTSGNIKMNNIRAETMDLRAGPMTF